MRRLEDINFNALDICAGSGIGSWVWERLGGRTVCYVEWDSYCQQILLNRMHDGQLRPAPIWDDLRSFDGKPWRGRVDFIFGGIPCQPWSVAGQQQGEADERDLWPDFLRVLREVEPRIALVENVPGLLTRGLGRILGELAESGYDAEWDCIPACAIGAPHRRDRVWVVAYARSLRCNTGRPAESLQGVGAQGEARGNMADADKSRPQGRDSRILQEYASELLAGQSGSSVADTSGEGLSNGPKETLAEPRAVTQPKRQDWWAVKCELGRSPHGISPELDGTRK